jgi:lipopolysaccharide/colanic/teichoic acid biosynthesis glycosyltransferase
MRVARATRRPRRAQGVLNEDLFRLALARQQKQSERFEEPFGLVRIALDKKAPGARSPFADVTDAVVSVVRSTDIVGWLEEESVIGIIRSSPVPIQLPTLEALRHACVVSAEIYTPGRTVVAPPSAPAPDEWRRRWQQGVKRALDLVIGGTALVMFSPLMLAIAAIVRWTSAGPALVRQERVGEHGRVFRMLKFRTMHVDASHDIHEKYVHQYIRGGTVLPAAGQSPIYKLVADPRVTRVGRLLRRSSLDELPQFWNVVKGEMSLVGPRPPLPYEVKWYRIWHNRRVMDAKPGMTGLWQVQGRSRTTFDEMVRLDLRYVRNQSLWNDIKILMATPRAVLSGEGAR